MLRTLFDTYDYDRCLIGSVLERHQTGLIFVIRWIHNAPSCITPVTTATWRVTRNQEICARSLRRHQAPQVLLCPSRSCLCRDRRPGLPGVGDLRRSTAAWRI